MSSSQLISYVKKKKTISSETEMILTTSKSVNQYFTDIIFIKSLIESTLYCGLVFRELVPLLGGSELESWSVQPVTSIDPP